MRRPLGKTSKSPYACFIVNGFDLIVALYVIILQHGISLLTIFLTDMERHCTNMSIGIKPVKKKHR